MKEYLIPDYYPEFQCKIENCRTPCCSGWPVSFSLDDYFSLTSKECSANLRELLDRYIKIKIYPTTDSYAEIIHIYTGQCPLQDKDGKCMIQKELGENALSDVCRLYPRGIRKTPARECSCASSCEKVVEMFLEKADSIKFIKKNFNIKEPPYLARTYNFPTMGKEWEIRLSLINKIQNRSLPFYKRILSLGMALYHLDIIIKSQDEEKLKEFFENSFNSHLPDTDVSEEHLLFGIKVIEQLLGILDEKSESIKKYGEKIFNYFAETDDILAKYSVSKEKFEKFLPCWESFFEHLIVNHMFFAQFPFQDREETMWDEYVALCSIYALLRFLSIGFVAMDSSIDDYTDMCASFFRLVEHTDFDRLSTHILKSLGCYTPIKIHDLIIV